MDASEKIRFEELKSEYSFKTTRRISNMTRSCLDLTGEIGELEIGDGWFLELHLTDPKEGTSGNKFLGLYLSAPKKVWGSSVTCIGELNRNDGTRFGRWELKRVFTDNKSWGKKEAVELQTLKQNLRDDSFTLVLNVQEIPAMFPRADASRPELSLPASEAINRSLTSPSDERDIKFLNYNSKPNRNLKRHVKESYSCGHILSNRTTYFSSHAVFSEGADVTTSERTMLESMPDFDASYDYLSDSDLESFDEAEDETMLDEPSQSHITEPSSVDQPVTDAKKWKIIMIGDVAHKTWVATLGFLYTDAIRFSSISSKKAAGSAIQVESQATLAFPQVSCKSVFRVADKLGIEDLEDLAYMSLKSQIDNETIFPEIFSSFTARYDRVKDMEFDYLVANWGRLKSSDILNQMLNEVIAGKRPQSIWLFQRIFQKLHV